MQHLSHLEQEAAAYRQQPSVQSAPGSVTHESCYHYQASRDNCIGQEAPMFSSSAPAHTISLLPAVRTSIPLPLQKQVRTEIRNRFMLYLDTDVPRR